MISLEKAIQKVKNGEHLDIDVLNRYKTNKDIIIGSIDNGDRRIRLRSIEKNHLWNSIILRKLTTHIPHLLYEMYTIIIYKYPELKSKDFFQHYIISVYGNDKQTFDEAFLIQGGLCIYDDYFNLFVQAANLNIDCINDYAFLVLLFTKRSCNYATFANIIEFKKQFIRDSISMCDYKKETIYKLHSNLTDNEINSVYEKMDKTKESLYKTVHRLMKSDNLSELEALRCIIRLRKKSFKTKNARSNIGIH